MRETIKYMADLINKGENIALYAVTPQASQIIHVLKISYNGYASKNLDDEINKIIQNLYYQLDRLRFIIQFDYISNKYIKSIRESVYNDKHN